MHNWRFAPARKSFELRARRLGTDHQPIAGRHVRLAVAIGLEQALRFLHESRRGGDGAEAPAPVDVEPGEVEPVDVQLPAVDHQHLAVVPQPVLVGPGHRDTGGQQAQLELAQLLLAALVGVGNQGAHGDASRHRGLEGDGDVLHVQAEDDDLDAASRAGDGRQDRLDAVIGLHDELHGFLRLLVP